MNIENLNLSDFTAVDIRGAFHFDLVRSDSFSVSISEQRFKRTRVYKEGPVLVVDHPWYDVLGWFTPWIIPAVKVGMPELHELKISGASTGSITGFLSSHDFKLKVQGASRLAGDITSGNAEFDVAGASRVDLTSTVKEFNLKIAGASEFKGTLSGGNGKTDVVGASKVKLSGSMADSVIRVAGASHLDMDNFTVQNADIRLVGASSCSLNIIGKLDAELAGASRLSYGGNPTMGNIRTVGASTLTRK